MCKGFGGPLGSLRPQFWGVRSVGILLGMLFLGGCYWLESSEVVVYTSLDRELVEPIFQQFTEKTGIPVVVRFPEKDAPAHNLLEAVVDTRGRPICDLVWHSEVVQMVRLQQEGLLAAYTWPNTQRFSQWAKSPDGRWHGLAARARVLLLHTPALADQASVQMPSSILDLVDPKYRGKVVMARPTSGTAAAQVACWFVLWGPQQAKQFLRQLHQNQVRFLSSEEEVVHQVAEGNAILALTDSDQAIREVEKGSPVLMIYPDQREEQVGTLFFPSTVGILRKAAHPGPAAQLADYLLSPEVETQLTHSPSAHIPLNYEVTAPSRVKGPDEIKAMKVDFEAAARQWDAAIQFIQEELLKKES